MFNSFWFGIHKVPCLVTKKILKAANNTQSKMFQRSLEFRIFLVFLQKDSSGFWDLLIWVPWTS
jgi:hypothetical protein